MSDPNAYRVVPVHGGFEAQMLYQCGAVPREEWFPLNSGGYWSDPDGFSFGLISKRDVHPTLADAHLAIVRAKQVNGDAT